MRLKRYFYLASFVALLIFVFRKQLTAAYLARSSGAQATADASVQGYTTYNQTIFRPGLWKPVLQFFKADSYVPTAASKQAGSDPSAYSLQG